jgi:hypothetical protein
MIPETGTLLLWLAGAAAVFIMMVVVLGFGRGNVANRLADVSTDSPGSMPDAGLGTLATDTSFDRGTRRRLHQEERKRRLRERMMHAGFYATASGSLFMMFRLLLIAGAAGLGFLFSTISNCRCTTVLALGCSAAWRPPWAPDSGWTTSKSRGKSRFAALCPTRWMCWSSACRAG